jgi:hypothetical protein
MIHPDLRPRIFGDTFSWLVPDGLTVEGESKKWIPLLYSSGPEMPMRG